MKKMMACMAAICLALPSFAADWTDANGNQYTALKSIKGNGSGATGGAAHHHRHLASRHRHREAPFQADDALRLRLPVLYAQLRVGRG